MKNILILAFLLAVLLLAASTNVQAQATSAAATIEATITDPSGAAIPNATVTISNKVTGFQKSATADASGIARLNNIPFHSYHLDVTAPGFKPASQDVTVRSGVPLKLAFALQITAAQTTVEVHSDANDIVESAPMSHTDVDSNLFQKLPQMAPDQGVSDAITMAVPGIVADSNGFFHPLGDHAETQFSIDNQPVENQQNKQASNQLPLEAIQSFEAVTGAPPPEFGDKASLVVTVVTKSGLGVSKPFGSFSSSYGSFGTFGENFTFGIGGPKFGYFIAANTNRSGRWLDSPEFSPLHDRGNNEQIFDRLDYQAGQSDTIHLNLFAARSWFQIPNTYDQQFRGQDQRQQVRTLDVAPGWVHLLGPTMILNVSPYYREDVIQYYPSRNPFSDLPATISQDRHLGTLGVKADISYVHGIHNAKAGLELMDNILSEHFALGVTDPNNPVFAGSTALGAYSLASGGIPFQFRGHTTIKEYGFFAQDQITIKNFTVMAGLRGDVYRGLTQDTSVQPRAGVSYLFKSTGTVLRASYSRFFETPYNENLILSSSTGIGGLQANAFGAYGAAPLTPGRRNQFQTGLQQRIGKFIVIDGNYFWKYTTNAFDFDTLFNTPITFPIEWRKSKIDGVSVRVNLAPFHGLTAYTVMGHTRARFFGPEQGGLIFNSPLDFSAFRIDHDEAFEQTTNLRYQPKKDKWWGSFTWRYDSGQVAGSVPDYETALQLTADQQQQIGLYCGNTFATLVNPLTSCNSPNRGATRLTIPAPGAANPDTNPPRIAPRNLFDLAVGTDDLFHTDRLRWTLQLSAVNLTNEAALYNFLSTFSGTHFVSPRAYRVEIGFVF